MRKKVPGYVFPDGRIMVNYDPEIEGDVLAIEGLPCDDADKAVKVNVAVEIPEEFENVFGKG